MSIQAVAWVLDESKSRGIDRLVLISIANHANKETGEAFPAMRTIQREAGVGLGTVSNAVARLVELGELEVVDQGTARRSATYRIIRSGGERESAERSGGERDSVREVNPPRGPGDERSARPRGEQNHHEPSGTKRSSRHPDAERLATLLADLIEANGSKRPNVTDAWVTEIDRMIRLDERPPDAIEAAIRWCQADAFWRANVLSASKLRAKYDQLRLQAARQNGGRRAPDRATRQRELAESYEQIGAS